MDLNNYIFPLRKWWWLIAVSTLIAAIFSSLSVLRQPTIYQARTTLMVGTTITDPNPGNNEVAIVQQLAAAYANIANREIVRNATMEALELNQLPEYIAQAIPNTLLIEIIVTDVDPQRAQTVANELTAQLVLLSPTSAQPEKQERQEFINQQLDDLEAQIAETKAEIEKLQEELANMISAQQINDKLNQISSLQSKLNSLEDNYGLLLSNTQQGAINTLTIIESAELPSNPTGPMKGLTILLAIAVGFVLAAGEAYLLEYLDNTLKSPNDVVRLFSAPILGRIFEQTDATDKNRLYDGDNSKHPLTEPIRGLRTTLDFAGMSQPLKRILVTSPDIGDGKTSVAVNLALSIAERDKKVYLLDADLRKPKIHELLNLANNKGLASLLAARGAFDWKSEIQEVRNMAVLTAGTTPPDPAGLLSSEKLDLLLSKLEEVADVVIIDGPPLFVADAMIIASKVNGILLVIRPGHTRWSLAKESMEQIKLVGAKVIGVILNRIPLRGGDYYAGQSYLYTYYRNYYGHEPEGKEMPNFSGSIVFMDLEKLRETLSFYANKVASFIKHRFPAVFKPSSK